MLGDAIGAIIQWALNKGERLAGRVVDRSPRAVKNFIREQLNQSYLDDLAELMRKRLQGVQISSIDDDYIPRTVRWADHLLRPSHSGASSLAMDDLVRSGRGFVLRASAGAGKSTSCYVLVEALARNPRAGTLETAVVPVHLDCRKLRARLDAALATLDRPSGDPGHAARDPATGPAGVAGLIRQTLLEELAKPFRNPGTGFLGLRAAMQAAKTVLVIEGLDELVLPVDLGRPVYEIMVEQLDLLALELDPIPLIVVVTTRIKESEALAPLRLSVVELEPIRPEQIEAFLRRHHPELVPHAGRIAEIFIDQLGARPLYLRPLLRYWHDLVSREGQVRIDWSLLLDLEVRAQIEDNKGRCAADRDGTFQRTCLRRLAQRTLTKGRLTHDDVAEIIREATNHQPPSLASQLRQVIPLFLREEAGMVDADARSLLQFPHPDVRDYWLADHIVSSLRERAAAPETSSSLVTMLTIDRVFETVVQCVRRDPPDAQDALRDRLIDLVNSSTREAPDRRTVPTGAAGALSLLARIADLGALPNLDCRTKCFQGLNLAGQQLSGVAFDGSSLRDSNLRGAVLSGCSLVGVDLDNAELQGADLSGSDLRSTILKNAGLGTLAEKDGSNDLPGMPTNLSDVKLEQSNWFNVRVTFRGYFSFWTAALWPDSTRALLATGRGELWLLNLDAPDAPVPAMISTGHSADIMDFDVLPGRNLLATASRDLTVRVFDILEPLTLRELARIEEFTKPPRNVAFSSSGRWLGVTDRSNNAVFRRVSHLQTGTRSESVRVSDHTGPILCLSKTSDGPRDVFYTAGYDGRLIRHVENLSGTSPWTASELVSLSASENPREPDTIRVVTPCSSGPGNAAAGIWIGGESGKLRFFRSDSRQCQVVRQFDAEIFRLGIERGGSRIAVGLADGRVHVFKVGSGTRGLKLTPSGTVEMPRRDIVRCVEFIDNDRLFCVAWAGSVRVWSFRRENFVFGYEYPEAQWEPALDSAVLRVSPPSEVDKIISVSGTFRNYLRCLH
jgi:WD40 repeat protein